MDEAGNHLKSQIATTCSTIPATASSSPATATASSLRRYIAGGFLGGDTQIYGFDIEASQYFLFPTTSSSRSTVRSAS